MKRFVEVIRGECEEMDLASLGIERVYLYLKMVARNSPRKLQMLSEVLKFLFFRWHSVWMVCIASVQCC